MMWVSNTMHRTPVTSLPPPSKLGQGYVFTRVCDSVHRGGLPQCMLGYSIPPQSRHHPRSRLPPGSRPPGADPPEQTPLGAVHAGRYGQQVGGTHPTGMHTCFALEIVKTPDNLCYFDSKSILSVIFY